MEKEIKMKCKVCKKDSPESTMSIECPECYLKGFDIEREKVLKLIDMKIKEFKKIKESLPEIKQQKPNESNQHMRLDASLSMLNTIKEFVETAK